MRKGQSILEYAIVLSVIIFALSAMSLYFRRGIQAVVKVAADEAGNQKDAEDINPITGTKTASAINRQAQTTQGSKILGGSRVSDINATTSTTGTSSSVSKQEK